MATVMKTSRDVRGIGLRIPRAGRAGEGRRPDPVRRRPPAAVACSHARLLRSPHAHARIKRIDTSKAKALKGVRAILTAADIPDAGARRQDPRPRDHGDRPGGLRRAAGRGGGGRRAGDRRRGARPDRGRVRGAAGRDRPDQVDAARTRRASPTRAPRPTPARRWPTPASRRPRARRRRPRRTSPRRRSWGAATWRRRSPRRTSSWRRRTTSRWSTRATSRRTARVADYDRTTGQLTVWASTQGSFNTRSEIADVLHIPEYQIKVIPLECGGGFGAKIRALVEPITVLLSKATGRPVKYIMTRREELEAGMPAPSVTIKLKTGVKQDGTPLALEGETIIEAGAYSGAVLTMSGVFLAACLPVADLPGNRLRGADPQAEHRGVPRPDGPADGVRDRLPHGPDRAGARAGPGRVQARSHLPAGRRPDGARPALGRSNGARECLEALMEHPLWKSRERVEGQRRQERRRPARDRPGGGRLGAGHPADERLDPAEPGRHADGADRARSTSPAPTRAWR